MKDPQTAKLLQPNNHPIGSKRICIDTDYFATFNRPNVTLVDIKSNPIEEITENAVRVAAQGLRSRRAGAGDRLRCDDGIGGENRYSRPQRADAEPEMGRGTAHLSGPDERRLSQSLRHHRSRQSRRCCRT